jgi:predicted O-methyltransferase YrrM
MLAEILEDLIGYLVPDFGGDVVVSSAALAGGREVVLRQMERLDALQPETIVEIGTKDGVMAALLSRFTQCVISFDTHRSPHVARVLSRAHARNVAPVHVSDAQRDMLLERLEFALAFIDIGRHDGARVASAFDVTRRCGMVLFHGYGACAADPLTRFVDTLAKGVVERDPPFAWWRAGEKSRR